MNAFETAKQLFFEGLQQLEANDLRGAESRFSKCLELVPDRVSTLNNLAAVKIQLEKFDKAETFARQAVALEPASPEAWSNLGIALTALKRPAEALPAYDRALAGNPAHAKAWLNKGLTLLELGRAEEALQACDQALQLDARQADILHVRSLALNALGRTEEAQQVYRRSLEMKLAVAPVFMGERRATQKAGILIVNHNPDLNGAFKSYDQLHLHCSNFPGQLARLFPDEFHFTFVFEGVASREAARQRIPPPSLVLNNCANGELILANSNLPDLKALMDGFGVPVVNHPTQVVQTTRDGTAKLLADIPGIRVPKIRRFSQIGKTAGDLIREIEAEFAYPLITRNLIAQEGKGMVKMDSRDALASALAAGLPENFMVTEFVDSRGKNGFFRKIRAAMVKDEIMVVRVDCDTHWKIFARKSDERVAFYQQHSHLLEEEKRICLNPEVELGRPVMQALQTIRDRIPLDVFGVDFDVDPAGQLVFYEANATMNLLSTAREEVPYPIETEQRLQQALLSHLKSLLARG